MGHRLFLMLLISIPFFGCEKPIVSEPGRDAGEFVRDSGQTELKREWAHCSLTPLQPLPSSSLQRCSRKTAACVRQCEGASGGCAESCLARDATPAESTSGMVCADCTFYQLLSCAGTSQCGDVAMRYRCCEKAKCRMANVDCQTVCKTEIDTLLACVGTIASHCTAKFFSAADGCFPKRYNESLCTDVAVPALRKVTAAARCSRGTAACVSACDVADTDCQFRCLAADKTPPFNQVDCATCAYNEYLACVSSEGCKSEVQKQLCCEGQACVTAADFATCSQTTCYEENTATSTCAESRAGRCVDAFVHAKSNCFPK